MNYLTKKTVKDVDVKGKSILLRCDFNVPLDKLGNITDTKRIDESLDTVNYLIDNDAKIILCSHMGKPKGKFDKKLSLAPVAKYLSETLKKDVKLTKDVIGPDAQETVNCLKLGELCLLENLRFEPGEEENDDEFSRKLASLAQLYVNDAFGTCHRAHASTVGVTKYLPSACGFLIEKEINAINKIVDNPKRPLVAILGGAKVSDKINVIDSLLEKVDTIIIGGGMSYTFMNALGYAVGNSICESDKISFAKDMMAKAKGNDVRFVLPLDVEAASKYSSDAPHKTMDADDIPEGWMGLDIGPKTIKLFSEVISQAGTVIWNGPLGVFEWKNYEKGTFEIAKALSDSDAISIVGGGDSAAAIEKFGFSDKMTHISTGGGAFLKFLEGKELPGLEAIDEK